VTFLGTGSAMPSGDRAQSGLLVTVDGDDDAGPLLVDCGSGVLGALARTDVGYEGVGTVLLTHHHTDHVADLLPLLKARWLAGADELPVVGPPGTGALVADLLDVHDYLRERVAVDARSREVEAFSGGMPGFDVRATPADHSVPTYAYRIERGDAGLAVSGDTEASTEVAAFADGVDALVHDCSFPDEVDVSNHPTPAELGDVLAGHDYGRVYLTHLYPHTEGRHGAMRESIAERYGGDVRFARDGLTVELRSDQPSR